MFEPVNNKVDFASQEEKILKFWEEKEIYRKSIEERPADNEYVFYDGPPLPPVLLLSEQFFQETTKKAFLPSRPLREIR